MGVRSRFEWGRWRTKHLSMLRREKMMVARSTISPCHEGPWVLLIFREERGLSQGCSVWTLCTSRQGHLGNCWAVDVRCLRSHAGTFQQDMACLVQDRGSSNAMSPYRRPRPFPFLQWYRLPCLQKDISAGRFRRPCGLLLRRGLLHHHHWIPFHAPILWHYRQGQEQPCIPQHLHRFLSPCSSQAIVRCAYQYPPDLLQTHNPPRCNLCHW